MPSTFVPFSPSVEVIEPDEADTHRELNEALHHIAEVTFQDSGHALRGVHAKSHGLLRAELEIAPGLPVVLAQDMFAKPGRHQTLLRFSTSPGDILDDAVSTPRGAALKVLGVQGDRLSGSEGDTTQDFLLVNGPAFTAPTAKKFLGSLKMLAKTTDKAPGAKKILSAALRGIETIVEAAGGESGLLKALGGHPETNILGETFYSQVPIRYGDYIAKISLAPVSPELRELTNAPLQMKDNPDALRAAVSDFFRRNRAVWELRVQLCSDLEAMPVEDASKVWPEDRSPFRAVARLTADPQDVWSADKVREMDDGMSFSPWHGLKLHQPLGSVMRARNETYRNSAEFRGKHNGCPMQEPRAATSTAD